MWIAITMCRKINGCKRYNGAAIWNWFLQKVYNHIEIERDMKNWEFTYFSGPMIKGNMFMNFAFRIFFLTFFFFSFTLCLFYIYWVVTLRYGIFISISLYLISQSLIVYDMVQKSIITTIQIIILALLLQ